MNNMHSRKYAKNGLIEHTQFRKQSIIPDDDDIEIMNAFEAATANDFNGNENSDIKVIWKFNTRSPQNDKIEDSRSQQDTNSQQSLSPILMKNPHSLNKPSKFFNKIIKNENNKPCDLKNITLSQEIKEITSALMADEMAGINDSIFKGSIVTSPSSFINDVSSTIQPVLVNNDTTEKENSIAQYTFNKYTGCNDVYERKPGKEVKNTSFEIKNSIETPKTSFQVPFKPGVTKVVDNLLKRNATEMHLDFSAPFAKKKREIEFENNSIDTEMILFDTQIISKLDERDISEEVRTMRNMSYEKQKMRIKQIKKRKINCKLLRGSTFTNKFALKNRISWYKCAEGLLPKNYDRDSLLYKFHLKKNVIDVSMQNIDDFVFSAWDYYSLATCKTNISGIECGDGAVIILDENSNITQERIVTSFLTSPGVDSNIINEIWVKNHIKWIILKLASMERSFPNLYANKICTPHNLMLQLKYRFDREVDGAEKSCLKKILQTDDTPSKPMVLYCADIHKLGDKLKAATNDKQILYEIELSDGWYSIRTKIDSLMSKVISDGKFRIGNQIAWF